MPNLYLILYDTPALLSALASLEKPVLQELPYRRLHPERRRPQQRHIVLSRMLSTVRHGSESGISV